MNLNRLSRKLHRWGAVAIAIPLAVVIGTGLLLQLKKQFSWIQPPTRRGTAGDPQVGWPEILERVKAMPAAQVHSWQDIDRLDVRPGRGIVKVRCRNRREVQLDLVTGQVLQTMVRRSDAIESLHDGSWFHDRAKLWVFLPNGLILSGLWLTGIYLWVLPWWQRRRNRKRRRQRGGISSGPVSP